MSHFSLSCPDFTLPSNLTTRAEYFVVLMGDSGNRSQKFTINAA